jgi:hypothetical protein
MPDLSQRDAAAVNSLRSAVMRLSRRLRHQRVDESLSATEMSVLGTLARCGTATPSELARKEHVQPPSMTRIVAMLEASRSKRNAWLSELAGGLDEDEWARLREAAPVLEKLAHLQ